MQRWNVHFCLSEPGVSVPQRLVSFLFCPAKRSLRSAEFVFYKGQTHILSHRSRPPTNEPNSSTGLCTRCTYPSNQSYFVFRVWGLLSRSLTQPFVVCDTSHPNSARLHQKFVSPPTRYMRVILQASAKLCRKKHLSQDKEILVSIRLDERQILQSLLPPAFLPEVPAHLQNYTSDSPSIIFSATCATTSRLRIS
jgi:hypothetical protein